MSREIKFRSWDAIRGKMFTRANMVNFLVDNAGVLRAENYDLSGFVQNLVVLEWTGLRDPAGVDIFEGDYVNLAGYGNYEVVFPFTDLYEAYPEGGIGIVTGNIYEG